MNLADSFDVVLSPTSSPSDVEASCNTIIEGIKNPEVLKTIATPLYIGKITRAIRSSNISGVKILHRLSETEAGMAALEEAAASTEAGMLWVAALFEATRSVHSLRDDAMDILLRFVSRSSKCASSAQVERAVPTLKSILKSGDINFVNNSLKVLCAIARSCAYAADVVAEKEMHNALLELMRQWNSKQQTELLELIACLAALSQGFGAKFIEVSGLDEVCRKGEGTLFVEEKEACVHALEVLTRGDRMEAIPDPEKAKAARALLVMMANSENDRSIWFKEKCFSVLCNFLGSECTMEYIMKGDLLHKIDVDTSFSNQKKFSDGCRDFLKEHSERMSKREEEEEEEEDEEEEEEKEEKDGTGDTSSSDSECEGFTKSERDTSAAETNGNKHIIADSDADDDCIVTGGTMPPCKKPAIKESTKGSPALVISKENYTLGIPKTLFIPKDFTSKNKPPETFKGAFDKLGLMESVYAQCNSTARKALEDKTLKSKLNLSEAQAITLYTLTSAHGGGGGSGGGDTPAVAIAKMFSNGNFAALIKWEPYILLLWTAIRKLKPILQDRYCCIRGCNAEIPSVGDTVFFPSFFCSCVEQENATSLLGGGEGGVVFRMKQTYGYKISKLAFPQNENWWKASEVYISDPGFVFIVESVSKTGNVTFVDLKFNKFTYD